MFYSAEDEFVFFLTAAPTAEREMACGVKKKLCYMALNCYTEWRSTAELADKKKSHLLLTGRRLCMRGPSVNRVEIHSREFREGDDLRASKGQHHHRRG